MSLDPAPAAYGLVPLLDLAGRPLEAPPQLAELAGYGGGRRHVSFVWGPGDHVVHDDGRARASGAAGLWGYWSRHPSVAPSLVGYDLGPSGSGAAGSGAAHAVVVDRFTSRLRVGPSDAAARFLGDAADLRAGRAAGPAPPGWAEAPGHGPAAVAREGASPARARDAGRFARAAFARLSEWLDARPLPCPACREVRPAGDYDPDDVGGPACPACDVPFYSPALARRLAEVRTAAAANRGDAGAR